MQIEPITTDEAIGLDILARAERPDGIFTIEEATRIARAIGWPPVRLDADGAVRPPTAAELAQWQSADPAITDTMTWPQVGEEIEHRSPAVFAALLASARSAVLALRDRDRRGDTSGSTERAIVDASDEEPVTDAEIDEWTAIGVTLVADPHTFRRVLAAMSTLKRAEVVQ